MSEGIRGKVVAIIGASSGIGAATAEHLAGKGAIVGVAARRTDLLRALVRRVAEANGHRILFAMPLSSASSITSFSQCSGATVAWTSSSTMRESCPCARYLNAILRSGTA